MLENATSAEIQELLKTPGAEVIEVNPKILPVGAVIRVETISGNIYLFEVTVPEESKARIFRLKGREDAPKSGYRGERVISIIKVGEDVQHGSGNTSPADKIYILGS